jgi:hypothetical protein
LQRSSITPLSRHRGGWGAARCIGDHYGGVARAGAADNAALQEPSTESDLIMAYVYRELDAQEAARLEALGIQSPWCDGPAMFGKPAVDVERGAMVVGLGGGNLGVPIYWALVVGREVLILEGRTDISAVTVEDPRMVVWVNSGSPWDSPLWRMPDLYQMLKKGLFMEWTGEVYRRGEIRFAGPVGKLVEES